MKRTLFGVFVLALCLGSVGCQRGICRSSCMGCGDLYHGDWYENRSYCGNPCSTCCDPCDPCGRPIRKWWSRLVADFEQPGCCYDSCGTGCSSCQSSDGVIYSSPHEHHGTPTPAAPPKDEQVSPPGKSPVPMPSASRGPRVIRSTTVSSYHRTR